MYWKLNVNTFYPFYVLNIFCELNMSQDTQQLLTNLLLAENIICRFPINKLLNWKRKKIFHKKNRFSHFLFYGERKVKENLYDDPETFSVKNNLLLSHALKSVFFTQVDWFIIYIKTFCTIVKGILHIH